MEEEQKQESKKTVTEEKKKGLGITSMVVGIVSILFCWSWFLGGILEIIAIIFGIVGIVKKKGRGMAIAGLVCGSVALLITVTSMSPDTNSNNTNAIPSSVNNVSQVIEYMAVDVDTLEDALDENAAAAKDTYNKKYLEITGRLGVIDSDLKYISLLSTTNDWDLIGVHCTVKNNEQKEVIKQLSKDDTIIVKGRITDVGEVLGYYLDIDEISKK